MTKASSAAVSGSKSRASSSASPAGVAFFSSAPLPFPFVEASCFFFSSSSNLFCLSFFRCSSFSHLRPCPSHLLKPPAFFSPLLQTSFVCPFFAAHLFPSRTLFFSCPLPFVSFLHPFSSAPPLL